MANFDVLIEKGEDGYFISEVIGLPGCHTQAKTMSELIERTKEAISLWLECQEGKEVESKFVGIQKIEV